MSDILRFGAVSGRLERAPRAAFVGYAVVVAFCTYFCMYAFRKPFSAAAYDGLAVMVPFIGKSVGLKTAFVVSQIVGYCISKFLGMKICSEVRSDRRLWYLVAAIGSAQFALLLFAVVPGNWKILAIFLNGLPLGMVWGLVVRYLEGRTTSELLLAGLSCSYIVASGIVKSAGRWLMDDFGVGEFWMPFATGMVFLLPFLVAALLLNQIPLPSPRDVEMRTERKRMGGEERWRFLRTFLPGMVLLCVAYFFLTAYRDFRDNYMLEIYGHFLAEEVVRGEDAAGLDEGEIEALRDHLEGGGIAEDQRARGAVDWLELNGHLSGERAEEMRASGQLDIDAGDFAKTDLPVGLAVLLPLVLLAAIKDNRRALWGAYGIMLCGLLLLGGGTWLLQQGLLSAYHWMVLVGVGAYLAYVPYGSVLFDRTIAATHFVGTAVFAIYLTDAIGYTGSVGMQIYKDLFAGAASRGDFFIGLTYFMSVLGFVLIAASAVYFAGKAKGMERRLVNEEANKS